MTLLNICPRLAAKFVRSYVPTDEAKDAGKPVIGLKVCPHVVVYDQYIEQNPHSFEGYQWKLLFISERKRYDDGLTTCEQCIVHNPHLAQAYEWRGRMLNYLNRDEEALASYEEAHRLDPGNEGILLSKVMIFVQTMHFDEALEICEQAIQLAPTKPSAYEEKGDILTRMKRYEDALPA